MKAMFQLSTRHEVTMAVDHVDNLEALPSAPEVIGPEVVARSSIPATQINGTGTSERHRRQGSNCYHGKFPCARFC